MKTTSLLLLATTTAVTATATADVTFYDGTFDRADWSQVDLFGTSSSTSVQMPTGGNPGWFLQITNFATGGLGHSIQAFHHYGSTPSTLYDPATSGTISSLNASIDFMGISGGAFGMNFAFALKQAGTVYRQVTATTTMVNPSWQNVSFSLTAQDFLDINGVMGAPDFSASGAPIRFGLYTHNNSAPAGAFAGVAGFDNFTVHVIPGPSAGVVLAAAGAFVAGRRRRAITPR